jgi:NADH dehydrogenase
MARSWRGDVTIEGPVFVTGGTGYIGSRVVAALIAMGLEVRAIARSLSGQRRLEEAGVSFAQLGSPELFAPMRQAIHQCRSAVHLAGALVEEKGNRFDTVNVRAGGMFARVAKEQGVAKAVAVTCVGSAGSARIRSQRSAEEALREAGVPFSILRLTPVYGPGSRLTEWLASFGAGERAVPASGEASWRPLHVDDAVEAVLRGLESGTAMGDTVEVGGGEAIQLKAFAERLGVPSRFEQTGNGHKGWFGRVRGGTKPLPLAPFPLEDLEMPMDPGTAGAESLGLSPRSLAEGLGTAT